MKSKTLLNTLTLSVMSFVSMAASGSSANFKTEKDATAFYNVNVKDNIDVEIRQSETPGLIIESDKPASEIVSTEIINGTLFIRSAEKISSGEKAKVIVMTPEIQSVVMDGSGNVTCDGIISSDYMKITVSGTGSITMDVRVLEVDVRIPGNGKVCLSGNAASSKINISGTGFVDSENLKTFSSKIEISGAGYSSVFSNDISVNISGAGEVVYRENPARMQMKVTGKGSINKI